MAEHRSAGLPLAEHPSSGHPSSGHPLAEHPKSSLSGESWLTTTFDKLEEWAQTRSFWPLPFGTACCAIEFMGVVSSHYDVARFGYEVVRFSPRQSDILIVAGTITDKMGPVLKKIYDQMPDPKWVISMGACACSGGFYRAYHVMQGIDEIIPVDVYVPGCPPSPEGLIYGILQLKEKVLRERGKHGGAKVKKERDEDRATAEIVTQGNVHGHAGAA